MPREDDLQRVKHMIAIAEELLGFTAGKSFEDLCADRGLQHICIHCLELLGEAANRINPDICDRHPDIPWRSIIAMRHRLIHGYQDIELSLVWSTISEDVPALLPHLQLLMREE
jgi:uncharacterized protein with HEPN domain